MSARPIRLRLCDAIHEQFKGEIEPLGKILGIPEDEFDSFLRGQYRLEEQKFERAARWLFDYEGRVKPATHYSNQVMAPTCEPKDYDSELSYEPVEGKGFELKRKSTEDLCQWIAQLEDQVRDLTKKTMEVQAKLEVYKSNIEARFRDLRITF